MASVSSSLSSSPSLSIHFSPYTIEYAKTNEEFEQILDSHRVDRNDEIGRGIIGRVVSTAHGFAVKLFNAANLEKKSIQTKFLQLAFYEARILQRITKEKVRHVPHLRFLVKGNLQLAIGMDRGGPTLRELYRLKGKIPSLTEIKELSRRWLYALNDLHKLEIIHGDIKFANLSRKFIYDFSHSLLTEDIIRSKTPLCSGWYRPPEIICGEAPTKAVDLFSLGAVIFELYTGAPIITELRLKNYIESALDHLNKLEGLMQKSIPHEFQANILSLLDLDSINKGLEENSFPINVKTFDERIDEMAKKRKDQPKKVELLKSFLRGLLDFHPERRLTAEMALMHRFLRREKVTVLTTSGKASKKARLNN